MRKLALVLGALSLASSVLAKEVVAQPVVIAEPVVVEEVAPVVVPTEHKPYGFDKLAIGAGVGATTKLYNQEDENIGLYPNLDIKYGRLYVQGIQLGVYLYESDMMAFSVFVDPMGGFKMDNSDMKSGYKNIDDRDTMVMGGGKVELRQLPGDVKVTVSYKGGEEGQQGDLVVMRRFPVTSKFAIIPSANASMFSSDFTDYYFGVSNKEVNRSSTDKLDKTYNGDTAYAYGAKLALEYMFTENVSMIASAGVTQFSSEIDDSPIVDNATMFYGALEAKYTF
ncbi:MAG: MipA/OmpV family protein [Fusobacteriaceae bacterium]